MQQQCNQCKYSANDNTDASLYCTFLGDSPYLFTKHIHMTYN